MQGRLNPRTKTNKTQTNLAWKGSPEVIHSLTPPLTNSKNGYFRLGCLKPPCVFKISTDGDSTISLGPFFLSPHCERYFFPSISSEFPFLQLVSIASHAITVLARSQASSFLHIHSAAEESIRIPDLKVAFSSCSSFPQHSLVRRSSPLTILVVFQWICSYMPMSFI